MSDQEEIVDQPVEQKTEKIEKCNDPNYIKNPKTGKWVKRSGPTGRRVLNDLNRDGLVEHIRHHSVSNAIAHRNLMKSDLSDKELEAILTRLVDVKLIESGIPVQKIGVGGVEPTAVPRRRVVKSHRRGRKVSSRNRFVVRPAPSMAETTAAEYTTAYEESSDSEY